MHTQFRIPLLILGLFFVSPDDSFSQIRLTENARVSIITFGPYQGEIYSAFGHSGIRVYDPDQNLNWVYDYGRFNFNQENFYWNFARGKMLYSIGLTKDFEWYKNRYIREDRYVYEQVLDLSPKEVQSFFDYLENNYLPENREYFYNYVFDNCATKIRDVVVDVVPYEIEFDYFYKEDKTIRDLMNDYLGYQPWGDFIIDLGLGLQIDREATGSEYMFLPDYIFHAFSKSTVVRDSVQVPLVRETIILYEPESSNERVGLFTPLNTFIFLFFVIGLITNRNFKTQKRSHWLDVVIFTVIGIFGWWFTFLWFGTEHLSKYNWNLLWAIPFHIPLVYFLKKESWKPLLSRVYRFLAVLHCLTLVFWVIIPQPLHFSLIPLLLILILRSFYISYDLGRYQPVRSAVTP